MTNQPFWSLIEALESRIAPAGVIDVLVKNGALFLKTLPAGDGAENLVISAGLEPNEYLLDPAAGTKLRVNGVELADGEAYSAEKITGLISISLGAGNDVLSLADTKFKVGLKVDLGSGENFAFLDRAMARSFVYKGGANGDIVSLNMATIAGPATVDLGAGNNSLILTGTVVAGDLAVKSGAGEDTIQSLDPLRVGGKFTAVLGDGNNVIGLLAGLSAGRDVSITTGAGADAIRLSSAEDYVIGGSLTVNSGKGADTVELYSEGVIQVGKNVSLLSGGAQGKTIKQEIVGAKGISVGGNVVFASGAAVTVSQNLSSALNIAVGGSIKCNASLGFAAQTIDALASLTVGKGITLTALEAGTQSIHTDPDQGAGVSGINGPVTITGGTTILVSIDGDLRGPLTINAGKTANNVQIGSADADSNLRIQGPITVKTNSRDGYLFVLNLFNTTLNGNVTLLGGAGIDQLYLADLQTAGNLAIDLGAGDDQMRFEKSSPLTGRSTLFGAVTVRGGAGNDTVEWSSADAAKDAVFAAKLVTIDGGAGTDTFTAGTAATFYFPVKTLNLA